MKVPYGNDLIRKKWVREGLLQKAAQSFWTPYTGMNNDNIVKQSNMEGADAGHTIVFDYDGNLAGKAIKGNTTAYGKGETKKKFNNKLTVEMYRLVAANGTKYDAKEIGALDLSTHEDSRSKLADLFVRFKDQALFDAVQGVKGTTPTHIVDLGSTLDYNALLDLETVLKTGEGFTTGSKRNPLKPFQLADGRPVWLFLMDSFMSQALKKSSNYQSMVYNADVRGNDNRAIKGVFGKIGQLLLVEVDQFFGTTDSTSTTWGLEANSVEIAGFRRKDANGKWSGQTGYSTAVDQISRGCLLGNNALQIGFGMMPDYSWQPSQDFGLTSESCLTVWMETQKTILSAATEDYADAKVASVDYGIINVDVKTKDVA